MKNVGESKKTRASIRHKYLTVNPFKNFPFPFYSSKKRKEEKLLCGGPRKQENRFSFALPGPHSKYRTV
jgi:hypothetical protein